MRLFSRRNRNAEIVAMAKRVMEHSQEIIETAEAQKKAADELYERAEAYYQGMKMRSDRLWAIASRAAAVATGRPPPPPLTTIEQPDWAKELLDGESKNDNVQSDDQEVA